MKDTNLALVIAEVACEKHAQNIEIIDVSQHVDYTDFVLVCSGRSDRQVRAIAEGIEVRLKELGVKSLGVEGRQHGSWVLMDFGSVVVHVFGEHTRSYYDIEGLWLDAERLPFDDSRALAAGE